MQQLIRALENFPGDKKNSIASFPIDKSLISKIQPALQLQIDESGDVSAAHRETETKDPTNYDAVWVRDSLWVYLALKKQKNADAKKVLWRLIDYFSSKAQLFRFRQVITEPESALGEKGKMAVPHIRYARGSQGFEDVQVNGQDQIWNHRQNDALGFFYQEALKHFAHHPEDFNKLNQQQKEMLLCFPVYFWRIKAWQFEDAGAWEEIDAQRTSSMAYVCSAVYGLCDFLDQKREQLLHFANELEFTEASEFFKNKQEEDLLEALVKKLKEKIPNGECGEYDSQDLRYRKSDAHLLSLLYPCRLDFLTETMKHQILNLIAPLVGAHGIKRYLADSYQAYGFWDRFDTGDTSSEESFKKRASDFQKGDEAQWFFDSWLSLVLRPIDSALAERALYRAICQLTPGSLGETTKGADGSAVPSFSFPESYNLCDDRSSYLPSPICPLNWAKASMILALQAKYGE